MYWQDPLETDVSHWTIFSTTKEVKRAILSYYTFHYKQAFNLFLTNYFHPQILQSKMTNNLAITRTRKLWKVIYDKNRLILGVKTCETHK